MGMFDRWIRPGPTIGRTRGPAAAAGVADHEAVDSLDPVENVCRIAGFANNKLRLLSHRRIRPGCCAAGQRNGRCLQTLDEGVSDVPADLVVAVRAADSHE